MQDSHVRSAEPESKSPSEAMPPQPRTTAWERTFRATGIPLNAAEADVKYILHRHFSGPGDEPNTSEANVRIKSLTTDTRGLSQVATISFRHLPSELESGHQWTWEHDGRSWTVDDHFHGLTVLHTPNEENHNFDLIAISGLGSHAYGSFKERGGSHMWLSDSLPRHIPTARIITYGYPSGLVGSQSAQILSNIAQTFQNTIQHLQSKPIIFVAHSLGGLVLKEAIIQCAHSEKDSILPLIYGVLLFGVPNDGLNVASFIRMVGDGPNRLFVESLGHANSRYLSMHHKRFVQAFNFEGSSEVAYFYETRLSPTAKKDAQGKWSMTGDPEFCVTASSATRCRPWEENEEDHFYSMDRNHSDLVKFHVNDVDYPRVWEVIQRMAEKSTGFQERRSRSGAYLMNETDKQFLDTLRVCNPSDDKTRIEKGDLLKESYHWILENKTFNKWHLDGQSRLLWINGPAGIGKTMLLCGIIDHLSNHKETNHIVSFFFCQGSVSLTRSATAVLCGLAYLLVRQKPSLISHVRGKLEQPSRSHFEGVNGWEVISKIVQGMLEDETLSPVCFIVDALDECETGVDDLLKFIERSTSTDNTRVKWLISSRHDDSIESSLATGMNGPNLSLDMNPALVSEAVNAYINYQVSHVKLIQHDKTLQNEVCEKLRKKADGTFLWVALVFDTLRKLKLVMDVKPAIDQTPVSVEKLYKIMLDQVASLGQHAQPCYRILGTVAIAYRPLHLLELRTLAGVEQSMGMEDLRRVVRLCGSFLAVREDHVYPVHQSAKEYLTQHGSAHLSSAEARITHRHMFTQSLQVMSSALRRNIYELDSPGTFVRDALLPTPDPLLPVRYSCAFWYQHLSDSQAQSAQGINALSDSGEVFSFLKESFLYWIEGLSLLEQVPIGVRVIRQLLCEARKTPRQFVDFLKFLIDAEKFLFSFASIIVDVPLQTYGAGLAFCGASSDIKVRFWNQRLPGIKDVRGIDEDGSLIMRSLQHDGPVLAVSFSPDGQLLATASKDKTVRLWDPVTGKCINELKHYDNAVVPILFSPDSQRFATGSGRLVRIWHTATGICKHTLEGHSQNIQEIAFSGDGELLGSFSHEGKICLWNSSTGALLQRFNGNGFALAPNSKSIAISVGPAVKFWNIAHSTFDRTLERPDGEAVLSMAFLSGSHTLLIATTQSPWRRVEIWDVLEGICKKAYRAGISDTSYSPDEAFADICSDGGVRAPDIAKGISRGLSNVSIRSSGTKLPSISSVSSGRVSVSQDGNLIASISNNNTASIRQTSTAALSSTWDLLTGRNKRRLNSCDPMKTLAFSTDGSLLATAAYAGGTVSIWETASGAHKHTFELHCWDESIAFSPDNKSLVVFFADQRILETYDIEANARKAVVRDYKNHIIPDATEMVKENVVLGIMAVGMEYLWEAASGVAGTNLGQKFHNVAGFSFSNDGKELVLASDTWIRVYDTVKGQYIRRLDDYEGPAVQAIAFSPPDDCIIMALEDGTIQLWDTELRFRKQILDDHHDPVVAVAMSPDGTKVASASIDGSLRLWEVETGAQRDIATLSQYRWREGDLRFAHDSRHLKTSKGWVPLMPTTTNDMNVEQALPTNSALIEKDWLSLDGTSLLWLPPDYRFIADADFCGNYVALCHSNGRVTLVEFESV